MVNLDGARLQFHSLAVARQIVGTLALDLDGGVLRRDLLDQPGEPRQQAGNRSGPPPEPGPLDDPALGIVGIAFPPPTDPKTITPAAITPGRDPLRVLSPPHPATPPRRR